MSVISLPKKEPRTPLPRVVAAEVRAFKGRYDVTQAQLAEVLGFTQSQVSKRLRGEIPFTLEDVDRLAAFFNVKPRVLLGERDSGPGPDGGEGVTLK